jgi:transposase
MMTSDRIALYKILQHKVHFDHKLIGIVEHLDILNADLNTENKRITISDQKLIKKNHDLK